MSFSALMTFLDWQVSVTPCQPLHLYPEFNKAKVTKVLQYSVMFNPSHSRQIL